jgi:hypothetical protein
MGGVTKITPWRTKDEQWQGKVILLDLPSDAVGYPLGIVAQRPHTVYAEQRRKHEQKRGEY